MQPETEGEEVGDVDIFAVFDISVEEDAIGLPLEMKDTLEMYDGEGILVVEPVSLENNDCVGIDVIVTISLFIAD